MVIENTWFQQIAVNADKAVIHTKIELFSDSDIDKVKIRISDNENNNLFGERTVTLKKGLNAVEIPFTVKKPELWWSNGLGEPHLYTLKTDVLINSASSVSKVDKIGLRSLKIINKPDQFGKSFYVELNGRPVFAKGANYIPNDILLPRVTTEKYEKIISDVVDANMNMLRVWGGGIYENDIFYELCDKNGIMVWQDFMFACSMYPAEGALLENMRLEAIDNVKRLRNHPSLALWCGNNESYDSWMHSRKYHPPEEVKIVQKQLDEQYLVMLPKVVKEFSPGIFYWPSSPFSEVEQPSNDSSGDRHYWEVWHGKKPIANYNIEKSRFFSEYGFQSFPDFLSVKDYAPQPTDWNIYSEVMMSHQRGGAHANGLINSYLLNEYQPPKDFESFLYMNQVLQADVIKTAIEAHRRDKPYCMGTLYWQLNDVWPVASWSGIDYYGRWKALHYFVKNAFRDILISPIANKDDLNIYIVSDKKENVKGKLEVNIVKLSGELISNYVSNVKIPGNISNVVFKKSLSEILKNNRENDVFVNAVLTLDNGDLFTNNYFFLKQKETNYPEVNLTKTVKKINDGYEVKVHADKFARAVYLSTENMNDFFDVNYFDLIPGEFKTVYVKSLSNLANFTGQLKVISLVDGYTVKTNP